MRLRLWGPKSVTVAMQKDAAESAPSRSMSPYGDGGRKRKGPRRQPSTPYDHPPTQDRRVESQSGAGWISKLINPAYHLFAGGATRLLPSVFPDTRSLLSPSPAPASNNEDGGETIRSQETRSGDQNMAGNYIKVKPTVAENPSVREGSFEAGSLLEERHNKVLKLPRVTELSDIEKMIEQSTLCSEDIDRLSKILHLKRVDAEPDRQLGSTSTSEKGNEANKASEKQTIEVKETPEDKGQLGSVISTPILQPTVQDEFGPSPVEIAKAFMTSRASKHEMKGGILPYERPPSHIGEMTSDNVLASPTPMSSIRWPGAMLQEETGFLTPYREKNKYGPIRHPRTPYSRAIYSESKSKLKAFGGGSSKTYISCSPISQSGLHPYRQSKKTLMEDEHRSVGPIRSSMRRRFASNSHVKAPSSLFFGKDISDVKDRAYQDSSLPRKSGQDEPHHILGRNIANHRGNHETDAFTGVVHPHTSKLARDILNQISRPPTLEEKSHEWKLVLARRNSSEGDVACSMSNGPATVSHTEKFAQEKEKRNLSKFLSQFTTEDNQVVSSASDAPLQRMSSRFLDVVRDSHPTPLSNDFQGNDRNNQKQVDHLLPSESLCRPSTTVTRQYDMHGGANRSASKPKLPPIFVEKSNAGIKFGLNNVNPTFTFPTAQPSSSLLEPPTPSVMPVSSIVGSTVSPPTFTFGDKKKFGPPLMFAFPRGSSTTIAPFPHDEPNFKFGLDESRVSFASIGKDEVCC